MSLGPIVYKNIDLVFAKAASQCRWTLYEHEVYEILKNASLDVPNYIFIKKAELVTKNMLMQFGEKLVIKIVSSEIVHKQKLGGVKIINNGDLLFVQNTLNHMKKQVLSHFSEEAKPSIEGFLLVEFVEFSKSLGNELLIGIKEDDAFGPVVTLSKGGDDAEFFAKYYDSANLFLPYLNSEEAEELAGSLKIINKFNEFGHPEYKYCIARMAEIVSLLAYKYSEVSDDRGDYTVTNMDVNPFVFANNGNFIAVDGYMTFKKCECKEQLKANDLNIEALYKPKGIAVVGVSRDVKKYGMGREIATILHDLGRKDLFFINIHGGSTVIGGKHYDMYQSFEQLPEKVELVVYAAPAISVPDFLKNLGRKKPRAIVMIPGIPVNMGYENFAKMLDDTKPEGIRIIGPNCMGVYYGSDIVGQSVNTLFIEEKRLRINSNEKSNVALLTQSGGLAITMIDKLKNNPIFKAVASFGNKYDVKITDLFKYFLDDELIKVIALYVEGFDKREGRLFYDLARAAHKPVIVYKGGRTEAGAQTAKSHTAALTGDYDTFRAAGKQAGVIITENAQEFLDCIKMFSLLSQKKTTGMKVAGVLNAGFEATIAADELGSLEQAKVSEKTSKRLHEINNHGLVDISSSIIDVTPMTNDVMYGKFVEAFCEDPNVDAIIVGIVPHSEHIKSTPETCMDENSLANILVRISRKYDKPLIVSVNGGEYYDEFLGIMEKGGIPVYTDIRSAVRTLEIFMKYYGGLFDIFK